MIVQDHGACVHVTSLGRCVCGVLILFAFLHDVIKPVYLNELEFSGTDASVLH